MARTRNPREVLLITPSSGAQPNIRRCRQVIARKDAGGGGTGCANIEADTHRVTASRKLDFVPARRFRIGPSRSAPRLMTKCRQIAMLPLADLEMYQVKVRYEFVRGTSGSPAPRRI
jgi:hypothetical protein